MHMGGGLITLLQGDLPFGGALPKYTTNMDDAWRIVEHFRGRFDVHIASSPLQYDVAIMDRAVGGKQFTASAPSAPEALCLAALRAVGVEIEMKEA